MPYALLLEIGAADIVFLGMAILGALVLVLISNPLTSWVNRLVKRKDQGQK